jgi:hypothetical protein
MIRANQAPWVSAILPAGDRPELVRHAVRSVLGQTYEHMEAIVVGSPAAASNRSIS